jgi:hypothetical protein
MPEFPVLTLVDPRAQQRAHPRRRALSTAVGMLVAGASAVPFLAALGR